MTTFEDLKKLDQWLCWKNENRGGKPTKVPYQVNGEYAKSNDSRTWNSHEACVRAVKVMDYDGIGFVFTSNDPYIGVDIDDCITDEGIHPKAVQIITHLNSYAEISPSETGVKIWVKDDGKIVDLRKKKFEIGDGMSVEVYREGRYFTVTGNAFDLTTEQVVEAGAELNEIIDMYVSKQSNVFDESEYDGIPDGEENFTEEECEAYLKNQIAIATYRIKNMKDGDKHRTRYIMGRLVGGAIQAVRNAGYQVSATEHKEIIDALYEANPPSDNHAQERKAIYDGVQAGANTPTRIRKLVQVTKPEIMQVNAEFSIVDKVREYYSGTHNLLDVNEMKLARLFVYLYSEEFKYSGDSKCWYEWNGRVWNQGEIKDKNKAMSMVQLMLDALIDYASDIPDDKERMKYKALVSSHMTSARINGIVVLAQTASESYFDIYQYEKYSYYFPVANGEIDMKTGTLVPSNKNHGFTRCSEHVYSEDADCPVFKDFLNTIFLGRQELIDYVQAAMGYSLMGDSGYQILFYCYGDGRNGKSTLFDIMARIAGEWHKETITDTILLHKNSNGSDLKSYIAQLKDVRVTTVPEIPENTQLDYALIKRITGGEKLSARAPHQAPVEFRPTHTLWLSGNKLPPMKQHDKGIWRRFKIIPFEYEYPESVEMNMNAVMEKYYKNEMSGILRWMVEGAMRLLKDNKFPRCEIVELKTNEFKSTQDIYELFLQECCDVNTQNESSYWVHKRLAWAVFNRWSDDSNVQIQKDKYKLTANIVDRLKFKVGKKGNEFYVGFRIKPEYLKNIYDMDVDKLNGLGRKDLDGEEEPTGFKPKIVQMPARNLPIPLDDVAEDTF